MQHHHLTASEWDELADDPDFIALLRARRRFIVPSTIFFLLFYLALPLGVAFAPAFMNQRVFGPLTFAYAFGFAQFLMAWLVLALYMHEARKFDDRAEQLVLRTQARLAR
ncbi:MAG TPA: DUF485 domain-containing protein [Candidatus Acidoferrum sp.]|nr:DUF485 domain-containing protein [Candidatus Acidoferrum sp.]